MPKDNRTVPAIKLTLPLTYQQEIFREVYHEDTLVIMARGLGLQDIVANLLHSYDAVGRNLVIVVGAGELDNKRFGEDLAEKAAISRAANARGLVAINTNVSSVASRGKLYSRGGLYTVTSRILVVDLLAGLLDPTKVTGLIILHAERVTPTSLEAFIVRMFRQRNKSGFLKAFSDNPEAFSSGLQFLSTIMRNLFLQKTSLWPRYHLRVVQSLEVQKADVVELEVGMTSAMQSIQNSALQCIEICISELRKANIGLDIEDWSVDSALHQSFDILIRKQLDPVWHRVSARTRQIASDLTTLRTLLHNLLSLDAVTFQQYLETVLASHVPVGNMNTPAQSPWLFLDAADALFSLAKRRVYTGSLPRVLDMTQPNDFDLVLEELPKWEVLLNVLDEISQNRSTSMDVIKGGTTLIMCKDRQACDQVAEYLQSWGEFQSENSNETQSTSTSSSRYMRRKFAAYHAWKTAFSNIRSSKFAQEILSASALKLMPSTRKAPPNKRRRIRGTAQFTVAGRDRTSPIDIQKTNSVCNHNRSSSVLDGLEGLHQEASLITADHSELEFRLQSPEDSIVVHPFSASDDRLLEEIQPKDIIMYSPNASFIRRIEVYKSSHSTRKDMRVYFMYYSGSLEEQTYLSAVRKEKDAFSNLIRQKSNMAITLTTDLQGLEDPQDKFLRTLNTRIAGGGRLSATAEPPRVIVDVREFRSSLPSLLHGKNITIVPCSLTVGDYILSPDICVERKSVKDLISSFKDGRLYTQVEAMLAGYREPMLLIEFDQDKSFSLEPFTDLSTKSAAAHSELQSKLILLTLHFPRLRTIWSSSPYQTAEIFEELKAKQEEPDPFKAVSIGLGDGDDKYSIYAQVPMDMLNSIPGISEKNDKEIILKVDSIVELSNMEESNLRAILGSEAGKRVHGFFNTSLYSDRYETAQPSRIGIFIRKLGCFDQIVGNLDFNEANFVFIIRKFEWKEDIFTV